MKIAFLGLGKMGTPMAKRLLICGHAVTVWNRNRDRAQALQQHGAQVADSAPQAVRGQDVVISMLFDDRANIEVLLEGGVMDAIAPGALHIACSTISVALSEQLTAEHTRRGIDFVGAPVFGRPNVADEGRLWTVVAGPESAVVRARPALEPFSRGISVAGSEPRQAHALKLGGNFLISAMIYSLSESFVYTESQGIEPEVFLETINSALFQSPFYAAYGKVMLHPPEAAGASIGLGAKDTRLLREAAEAGGVSLELAETLAGIFEEAKQAGLEEEDWAVGQYRIAKRRAARK